MFNYELNAEEEEDEDTDTDTDTDNDNDNTTTKKHNIQKMSNLTTFDTNIFNYTLSELMAISSIENLTADEIKLKTDKQIQQFKISNPTISVFFQEIQSQLLHYADGLVEEEEEVDEGVDKIIVEGFSTTNDDDAVFLAGDQELNDWVSSQNLTQKDSTQTDKITERKQKVQTFSNQHAPMKREQLATTDTFSLPVKQDSLNPNLKNTITRFVNLDSQFRQYTNGQDWTSTNYTCDLSDTLKNALSLSLYSYQIPFSWYTIDPAYGNTCLWIVDAVSNNAVAVVIPAGNYSPTDFQKRLNASFLKAGFTTPAVEGFVEANNPVHYDANSGIITMFLYGGEWTSATSTAESFTITTDTTIVFYDFTGVLQCNVNCASKNSNYFNSTLGWIMGYRIPFVKVFATGGNSASSILDLNGTKYLILVVDDYNQNYVNNSLVSISQYSNNLKMPSYYSPDLPYTCLPPGKNNLLQIVSQVTAESVIDNQTPNVKNGLLIAGKYENDYTATPIALPSAPRTLTQAQIYTINSINSNNNNNHDAANGGSGSFFGGGNAGLTVNVFRQHPNRFGPHSGNISSPGADSPFSQNARDDPFDSEGEELILR